MSDIVQAEWWQQLFTSSGWENVNEAMPAERTAAEMEIILRYLDLPAGSEILDVPCGGGRHSIELASRGYRVTGLDFSPQVLERARHMASGRGVDVKWVEGDMRRLDWHQEFDAALCYWGSFGYFDEEGNFEFLRSVAMALRPGGKLILDAHVLESVLPQFLLHGWVKVNDVYMIEERRYDHETSRIETDWTFMRDNGAEKQEWHSSIRIYSYRELVQMLRDAGFTHCEGFDPFTGKPFALKASRLCMVATR